MYQALVRPANRRLQVAVLAFHKLPVQPLTSRFSQRRDLRPSWEVTHSRPRSSFQATHRAFVQHHKDPPQCGQVRKLSEGQTKSLGSREVRALRIVFILLKSIWRSNTLRSCEGVARAQRMPSLCGTSLWG